MKAAGWMERDRSLLLWRTRYSRFRTDVRESPGMLRMEFFSRCSSTRLRGKPFGTTLRLLFDKSRHSRLLSWLPGEKGEEVINQSFDSLLSAFSLRIHIHTVPVEEMHSSGKNILIINAFLSLQLQRMSLISSFLFFF